MRGKWSKKGGGWGRGGGVEKLYIKWNQRGQKKDKAPVSLSSAVDSFPSGCSSTAAHIKHLTFARCAMGAARWCLILHRQQRHAVLCLQRRDRLEIFAERGGKAKQGKEQMWERQVSLPGSLSHVTQCFMKTVANLTKKRWETCHWKADLCFFPQVSPRGPAGIKPWGFAFHWVQAVRVQTRYPRLQFFPYHTTAGCPAKDCCGSRLEDNYKYQQMKVSSKIWASYLPEVPKFSSVHWEMLALISGNQYCHQHNTTDFLIKLYVNIHPRDQLRGSVL